MFTAAKRIYLHPSHVLEKQTEYHIDSNMGGAFTVLFVEYKNDFAVFRISHYSPPPDGWDGVKVTIKKELIHEKVFFIAPESPYLDAGKKELTMLMKAGYPINSTEIARISKMFPNTKA